LSFAKKLLGTAYPITLVIHGGPGKSQSTVAMTLVAQGLDKHEHSGGNHRKKKLLAWPQVVHDLSLAYILAFVFIATNMKEIHFH
jgi:hypothetical protein